MCIRIEFKFISQENFSRMCIHICYKMNYCKKRKVCASNSKSMALGIFHLCVCIEFVIQVLKQKNAHVSFPIGMVGNCKGIPRIISVDKNCILKMA